MSERLNLGCGPVVDPSWVNVDLVPRAGVRVADLRRPLEFAGAAFEAVYASHVLEHLSREGGAKLLHEIHRVLRPGGVARIVVPDLEALAREYLDAFERGDDPHHEWAIVELIDQLVRDRSGGRMAELVAKPSLAETIERRIGAREPMQEARPVGARLRSLAATLRGTFTMAVAAVVGGARGRDAVREGWFRAGGEVHRWMYDARSLSRALQDAGFSAVRRVRFDESVIPGFTLDGVGTPRKPDSLYVEARKP